jgi:hypothetical protein
LFGLALTAPSTKSGAVLLELSRSRMRDSGGDQLPPDVRFAGKPAEMRAPPWITDCPHQLLTESPSCEAEHMAASTKPRAKSKALGACLQVGDERFNSIEIERLYEALRETE